MSGTQACGVFVRLGWVTPNGLVLSQRQTILFGDLGIRCVKTYGVMPVGYYALQPLITFHSIVGRINDSSPPFRRVTLISKRHFVPLQGYRR